jgi:hypothetical protein
MLIDLHVHSHHTQGCTLAPRDVLRRAREAGLDGVAFTDLNTLDGLSAIEGLNVRRKGPANDLAVEAADHMNLPCTGASGALGSLDDIGKAATLFRDPVASEADLVKQLRAGSVFCVAIGVTPGAADGSGGERRGPERRDRGEHRGERGERGEGAGRRRGPRGRGGRGGR